MADHRMHWSLGLCVAVSLAGCHLIFPYPEGALDQGALDQGSGVDRGHLPLFDGSRGDGDPSCGTPDKPCPIANQDDLVALYNESIQNAKLPVKYYALIADIALNEQYEAGLRSEENVGYFYGVLLGQGHFIFGLTRPLFEGVASDASIQQLSLTGVLIDDQSQKNPVGALARKNLGALSNLRVRGRVSGTSNVGGLVGINDGRIEDCVTVGIIKGQGDVGGLVGTNTGTIVRSSAQADVVGEKTITETDEPRGVGGAVGTNGGTIEDSFATGNVHGSVNVGGLVGFNDPNSKIQNCYAVGQVEGDIPVGGLVGQNQGAVEHSFAAGVVLGAQFMGGLVGLNQNGTYKACLWNKTLNSPLSGVGSVNGQQEGVFGRHQYELQRGQTYLNLGWNFGTPHDSNPALHWSMIDGHFPVLKYQETHLTFDPLLVNERKIGWSHHTNFPISGTCKGSEPVMITGEAAVNLPCSPQGCDCKDDKWSASLDFTYAKDGPVYIQVEQAESGQTTILGRTFILERPTACDPSGSHTTGPDHPFSGGNGSSGSPYLICEAIQLQALMSESKYWENDLLIPSYYFKLGDDIDLSFLSPSNNIQPIGNMTTPFKGSFDGNGFRIEGLSLTGSDIPTRWSSPLGLFGYVKGATITNLGLLNPSLRWEGSGSASVGALVGKAHPEGIIPTTIKNCQVISEQHGAGGITYQTSVSANSGTGPVGGLVGLMDQGTIERSSVISSVQGAETTPYTGGLVGQLHQGELKNVYMEGAVRGGKTTGGLVGYLYATSVGSLLSGVIRGSYAHVSSVDGMNAEGDSQVGGLVGWVDSTSNNVVIASSWTQGSVMGGSLWQSPTFSYQGGAVGFLEGNMEDCASYMMIDNGKTSGGLVGILQDNGVVSRCYATGSVTSDAQGQVAGGLIGQNFGKVEHTFALGSVKASGITSSAGGLVGTNYGAITRSYAAGNTVEGNSAGGLVGLNAGELTQCFASNNVTGGYQCGHMVAVGNESGEGTFYNTETACSCCAEVSPNAHEKVTADLYQLQAGWIADPAVWITVPWNNQTLTGFPVFR